MFEHERFSTKMKALCDMQDLTELREKLLFFMCDPFMNKLRASLNEEIRQENPVRYEIYRKDMYC